MTKHPPAEPTYPVRSVIAATGLSEHTVRAWERRYQIVVPERSPGGSRRYRAAEIERLRLVKACTDAGHRLSDLGRLSDEALRRIATPNAPSEDTAVDCAIDALRSFDEARAERVIGLQLAALDPLSFCEDFASPLLTRIGEEWCRGQLCVASEHIASSLLRSCLIPTLQTVRDGSRAKSIALACLENEHHDLGLTMAAVVAARAGLHPILLGPHLPAEQIAAGCKGTGAAAVVLSMVRDADASDQASLSKLVRRLDPAVHLWIGGRGAATLRVPRRAERLETLRDLDARVRLLASV